MTSNRIAYLGNIFASAILAGLFIGIAGTVFLSIPATVVGALFFGFGLLTIVNRGFKLFTGAIGYLAGQGSATLSYLGEVVTIWAGNLAGCWLAAFAVSRTRVWEGLLPRVTAICETKSNDGFLSLLILGIFCGMLMYLAVDTMRNTALDGIIRTVNLFLCVSVFILCGFEHCIADMFY
ncbi:MAG: formate/nitrite transporter family protein, partial [Victivallales bacterium]|nr:formate/nitrite transporter family protein [Victivallales bacterium]